jgi:undecaprenyl-diphosphatase
MKARHLSTNPVDEKLLLLINHEWTNPAMDRLMAAVSCFELWVPLLIAAGIFVFVRCSFQMKACVLVAGLAVGLCDGVVSRILKRAVDRPRPHQSHNDVRIVDLAKASPRFLALARPLKVKLSQSSIDDVDGRSFPSSHTMNTAAVAVVATAFFGARAAWVFILPLLVGYSRVYTGSHWPSDVVTSLFLGAGSTLLLLAALNPLWRLLSSRFWPDTLARHPNLFAR